MSTTTLIFNGVGGQGVQAMAKLIADAAVEDGLEALYTTRYAGAKRGGMSESTVIISDRRIGAPMAIPGKVDVVVAMYEDAVKKYEKILAPGGIMLINGSVVQGRPAREDLKVYAPDIIATANKLGNSRIANTVMVGALLKLCPVVSRENVIGALKNVFSGPKEKLFAINKAGIEAGFEEV
jgi:2-oxoglutarate ferredoxin oxidoreductase subunit gamma